MNFAWCSFLFAVLSNTFLFLAFCFSFFVCLLVLCTLIVRVLDTTKRAEFLPNVQSKRAKKGDGGGFATRRRTPTTQRLCPNDRGVNTGQTHFADEILCHRKHKRKHKRKQKNGGGGIHFFSNHPLLETHSLWMIAKLQCPLCLCCMPNKPNHIQTKTHKQHQQRVPQQPIVL